MQAFDIPSATLHAVARDMGITVKGDAHSFVLRPESGSDLWRKIGYGGRRVNAVTWDGHYVFMERVLNVWPEGRIKSALADYRGLEDFYAKAHATRY